MPRRDARTQILVAAEDLLARKRQQDITISEIAASAGVADSAIYHYFKNKEDLVFSITGLHLRRVIRLLDEQLQGIPEPVSRLSKMCWFHLHYNLVNQRYSRILLFECRPNRSFYQHDAYRLIRQYSGVMLGILEDGVHRGAFREGIDMRLVRDIILGGLDWRTVRCLSGGVDPKSVTGSKEITELVANMIQNRAGYRKEDPDKQTRIARAAEWLFSANGFGRTSIAEIAKRAGVAEGTVYEYFENKLDLLFFIPRMRFKEHLESLTEVFEIKAPLKRLRRFIRYHYFLYMTQPAFARTFLLDVQLNPQYYNSEALSYFEEYASLVDTILHEGRDHGTVRQSVDVAVFKDLLFGGFSHIALRWLILDSDGKFDKMSELDEVVSLLVRAVADEDDG